MDTTVHAADSRKGHEGTALTDLSSHLFFWPVAGLFLWLDLWSKQVVFESLAPSERRTIIPHFLEFRRSLNDGAVFGSFTGYVSVFIAASLVALGFVVYLFSNSSRRQHGLHVALGLILAGALGNLYDRAFVIADVVKYTAPQGNQETIIGRILNHDEDDRYLRVGSWPEGEGVKTVRRDHASIHQQGVVRDFVRFLPRFPAWVPVFGGYDVWPWIFNVADAALVCGVAYLLTHCWLERKPKKATHSG